MKYIALLDYDNIASLEASPEEVEENIQMISDFMANYLTERINPPETVDLNLRFYGGWTDVNGNPTKRGNWLERKINSARTIIGKVRVIPVIIKSPSSKNHMRLKGLYRVDKETGKGYQKMVDTLMCLDIFHFSSIPDNFIDILSDDDDLVPAILSAENAKNITVVRHRAKMKGLNDLYLVQSNVEIKILPPEIIALTKKNRLTRDKNAAF